MKNGHSIIGSVIDFDPSAYPFDSIFLDRVRAILETSIDDLSLLHESVDSSNVGAIYDGLYATARERPFRNAYQALVRDKIAEHLDGAFHFQRVPGIRIHLPGARTVQYHSDYWYGHGPEALNFWLPITRSFESNSLFVATLEDSLRETDTAVRLKLSQPEIDERLRAICRPVELDFGAIQVFNAMTAHGTIQNDTQRTRISIDFRVLMSGCDPGSKDIREYYVSSTDPDPFAEAGEEDLGGETMRVESYIFPKHGFSRFVPATSQRGVVRAYADQKHLRIVAESTEIYPMNHHPTLLGMAAGQGMDTVRGVLLFSVVCLPREPALRTEVYETATRSGTTLFFANENLVFPGKATVRDIESALEQAGGV